MSFVKRRIMRPEKVDIGGKLVRKWTGWYYVEAFDSSNGVPSGHYLCPPCYEDFSALYEEFLSGADEFENAKTSMLEYGDDMELDIERQVFCGGRTI